MSKNLKLKNENSEARILLHACCAPCSTIALERLVDNKIVVLWYNPNIEPKMEHDKRLETLKNFLEQKGVSLDDGFGYDYAQENLKWHQFIEGFEDEPEGGKRCEKCFEFRLRQTAMLAASKKYDFFTTTLTVSPHKATALINKIGNAIEGSVDFLECDFKKKNGYQRSVQLSKDFGLYRQNYCGCRYSKRT